MDIKTIGEHRRLAILRHLAAAHGCTSNSSILFDVVNGVGVSTSMDQMVGTLAWLQEQELIVLSDHGEFSVATATIKGVDVGLGKSTYPGVKKPRPRS